MTRGWAKFFKYVEVGGALPCRFEMSDLGPDGERVRMSMDVPCVKTGETITIIRVLDLPPWGEPIHAAEWVRDQVHWFYRHEADEQIRVHGYAVFEPVGEHAK